MSKQQTLNLTLRALMELGIVLAFGYWGYQTGQSLGSRLLLCIGAPVLGFGIWGSVDFHQAGSLSEPLRLIEELVISGSAAVALYSAGQPLLAWLLGLLSIAYHALVYMAGDKLLKH